MNFKKYLALGTALTLTLLAGCGSSGSGDDQIVIYSNADEEACHGERSGRRRL